jgi:hypothetical protein
MEAKLSLMKYVYVMDLRHYLFIDQLCPFKW